MILLFGIVSLFIIVATFLAAAYNVAEVWYVAAGAPVICALPAVFISLLIMPYSLKEATATFQVRDYLGTVDPSEFIHTTFDRLPNLNHKGAAMYTLLRVLYVITSSRKKADTLFRQMIVTSGTLYELGNITTNTLFFSYIRMEITNGLSEHDKKHLSAAIRCAINLTYEMILSAHKAEELTLKPIE